MPFSPWVLVRGRTPQPVCQWTQTHLHYQWFLAERSQMSSRSRVLLVSDLGEPVPETSCKSTWNTLLKGLCNCLQNSDAPLESSGQDLIVSTSPDSCVFRIVRLISTFDRFLFQYTNSHRPRYFIYTLKIVFSALIEPERPPEDVSLSFTAEYV